MTTLLRGAGRRDLEAIHQLWKDRRDAELKLDARLVLAPSAEATAREHRELVLADPRTRFVVADHRGRIVGFAHAQIETNELEFLPERYGVLVDLVVHPEHRRRGLGLRLLQHVDEWLHSRGVEELRARVLDGDHDARSFLARAKAHASFAVFRRPVVGESEDA